MIENFKDLLIPNENKKNRNSKKHANLYAYKNKSALAKANVNKTSKLTKKVVLRTKLRPLKEVKNKNLHKNELNANNSKSYQKMLFENLQFLHDKKNDENLADSVKEYHSNESTVKNPIVFIPGISGSELYYIDHRELSTFEKSIGSIFQEIPDAAKRIWPPAISDRDKINFYINADTKAYGFQQGDLRKLSLIERHHGPMGIYLPLLTKLINAFPDREIYMFSYDWRQTNEFIVKQFAAFLNHITGNKKTKVDIVAHSMGGIISALYMEKNDKIIDKYVSFGTPYEGASKAFNQLASGKLSGDITELFLQDILGIDLSLPSQYDSLIELFPTKKLIDKYPYHLVVDKDKYEKELEDRSNYLELINPSNLDYSKIVKKTSEADASQNLSYSEVKKIMSEKIGGLKLKKHLDLLKKFREHKDFNCSVKILNRKNALFFVGTGMATEVSAYFILDEDGHEILNPILTKEGDSVVPLFSATMGFNLDELPDHLRKKFVVRNDIHLFLLSDPYNLDKLVDFLSD